MIDLLVEGASAVFTGAELLPGAVVGVDAGRVVHVGPPAGHVARARHDARGGLVTPGLVDAHTHLVFGGDRAGEFEQRARGRTYRDIALAGGGIAATMRATRAASVEALAHDARARLDRLLAHGVTTAEVKSGYGLDTASELKILETVRLLDATHAIDLVPTFLGAHTLPPERRSDRRRYVDEVVGEMIPEVAARGLAAFCDVFVDETAFTTAEAERVLRAGLDAGLRAKVHADQLSAGGGAELAAALAAVSADHLEHVSEAGIAALAKSGTVAVLLPGAALFLGAAHHAPARRLIEAGVPVALSTDCNPGTCMTENLHLMLTLGMSGLGLGADEALAAVTVHAARAIGREAVAGRLEPGRLADLAVFDVPSPAHLAYHFGVPHTSAVFKAGRRVFSAESCA